MRRTLKLHPPLLAHYNWQKPQLDSRKWTPSVISLSFIPCVQSNLYADKYKYAFENKGGPSGGPWTRSIGVVHGPGPSGGPWTRSTGVVHGPGSTFCIRLL